MPGRILENIASLSFLDLVEGNIVEADMDWFCSIYVAFDKVAKYIDYKKLKAVGDGNVG